jgi:hypothetical protein
MTWRQEDKLLGLATLLPPQRMALGAELVVAPPLQFKSHR